MSGSFAAGQPAFADPDEVTAVTELPPDPRLGRRLGSYKLTQLLGRGNMGAVYLGVHPTIGSRVAVKVLHPWYAGDADVISRFFSEAIAVNVIGHPNIVQILDFAVEAGDYYCVMEYLEGETLSHAVAQRPMEPARLVLVFAQIADALAAAHDHGVIHRDLKPDNIFVLERSDGVAAKVVDFGIARLSRRPGADGDADTLLGSLHFMAPEQMLSAQVDGRADIYSLGITMYYAATGRLPYDAGSIAEILVQHARAEPRPPDAIRPEIGSELARVILKAMARRPEDRYQSMAEFLRALPRLPGTKSSLAAPTAFR